MKQIPCERYLTAFTKNPVPAAYAASGETVEFCTRDCFAGRLKKREDTLSALPWDTLNPATGPLFVEGAEPGDTLKVEILKISVAPQGTMVIDAGDLERYGVSGTECSMQVAVSDGKVFLDEEQTVQSRPMVGVIGTAPEEGSFLTTMPGPYGGNLDNNRITEGATVYLPVFQTGGLLAIGDLHAAMGDGEAADCGVEIDGTVTVRASVMKKNPLPVPAVCTASDLQFLASAETLDQAVEDAVKGAMGFLSTRAPSVEALWKLLGTSGQVSVCQFVNKKKTVRLSFPLPLIAPYCGDCL